MYQAMVYCGAICPEDGEITPNDLEEHEIAEFKEWRQEQRRRFGLE